VAFIFNVTVSRDFLKSGFLHQTTPSWPLIHGSEAFFEYGCKFADIFDYVIANFVVSGVNDQGPR
jgi:hypothetical protein